MTAVVDSLQQFAQVASLSDYKAPSQSVAVVSYMVCVGCISHSWFGNTPPVKVHKTRALNCPEVI